MEPNILQEAFTVARQLYALKPWEMIQSNHVFRIFLPWASKSLCLTARDLPILASQLDEECK